MSSRITLSRFLIEQQRKAGTLPPELRLLIETVGRACKAISYTINKGELAGILGEAGTGNTQGEAQKKLDVIANDFLLDANEWGGSLAAMASEEMERPYYIPGEYPKGDYLLLFDPLDGSSNIDVNISVGTIFSILRCPPWVEQPTVQDFLQPGTKQVAAGYAIYGPQSMLVLTFGSGVHGFTLDREYGSFVMTHPGLHVPEQTSEFAINMSNRRHWETPVTRYIDELLAGSPGLRGRDFNMRWVASMVAEVHRILNRGGIFMYPRDSRVLAQTGRLRLMYEANPMAFIIEQAGGAATNGYRRIMEVIPTSLHERVAVFLGSKEEVERITDYHINR